MDTGWNGSFCVLQWGADCYGCQEELSATSLCTAQSWAAGNVGPQRASKYMVAVYCLNLNREGYVLPTMVSLIAEFTFIAGPLHHLCMWPPRSCRSMIWRPDWIARKKQSIIYKGGCKTVTIVSRHTFRFLSSFAFIFILIRCQIQWTPTKILYYLRGRMNYLDSQRLALVRR